MRSFKLKGNENLKLLIELQQIDLPYFGKHYKYKLRPSFLGVFLVFYVFFSIHSYIHSPIQKKFGDIGFSWGS